MLNFSVDASTNCTGVTSHGIPSTCSMELLVNPEPCTTMILSSDPIGTRGGSTDVSTGAGARTVKVTSIEAGVAACGVRLTEALYEFGASPAGVTDTATLEPLAVTISHAPDAL